MIRAEDEQLYRPATREEVGKYRLIFGSSYTVAKDKELFKKAMSSPLGHAIERLDLAETVEAMQEAEPDTEDFEDLPIVVDDLQKEK